MSKYKNVSAGNVVIGWFTYKPGAVVRDYAEGSKELKAADSLYARGYLGLCDATEAHANTLFEDLENKVETIVDDLVDTVKEVLAPAVDEVKEEEIPAPVEEVVEESVEEVVEEEVPTDVPATSTKATRKNAKK